MPASRARKAARQRQYAQTQEAAAAGLPLEPPEADTDGGENTETTDGVPLPSTSADSLAPQDSTLLPGHKSANSQAVAKDNSDAKKVRFIVFVGNLPFGATTESITAHFAKVEPVSVRHATEKREGDDDARRSRGFAFLEFDRYDRMKDCLRLYHKSLFEDGGREARRINIELTVGGGGRKSRDRKAKLRAKNEKLAEERQRLATQRKDEGKGPAKKARLGGEAADVQGDHSAIHPSRRGRVKM